ncbi:MAG: hypothetical protein ABFR82_13885 [Nitrospirota bacterium]
MLFLILPASDLAPEPVRSLTEVKSAFEKSYISYLMELTKGNVSRGSELAGRYRADFYNLLKKHKLNPEDYKNN